MDVYLMQHGEAVSAEADPERPLTDAGRAGVAAVAAHAAACGVRIDQILHSDKPRAAQTASILAEAVGCTDVQARDGLHPKDPVDQVADALLMSGQVGSIVLVGHLPFLDRLASQLVVGDPSAHVVAFRNGGLVALAHDSLRGRFSVAWAITPEVAR